MMLRIRMPGRRRSTRGRAKEQDAERAEQAEGDHRDLVAGLEAPVPSPVGPVSSVATRLNTTNRAAAAETQQTTPDAARA